MTDPEPPSDTRDLLARLGYSDPFAALIQSELDALLKDINFDRIKQSAASALAAKDTAALIASLEDLMLQLENRGYYRPDAPTRLIKLLVNGLAGEDIFAAIEISNLPAQEKGKEQEFLASCAAITQLGYILLSRLLPEVKAATSGPHVFLIVDTPGIFVDFSIGSIRNINVAQAYSQKEGYYHLKAPQPGADEETLKLLTEYYSLFHVTSGLCHNIHNNLGLAYDKLGRCEEAVEELQEALRLDPAYIEVHNNLAAVYSRMGMYDEALGEFKEALRLKPGYAEARSNLGSTYAALGRYDEAVEELKEALRLGYEGAHNSLGSTYALQGRTQEALGEFQEAVQFAPDSAGARSHLGDTYAELGMYEDALREYQEALQLDSGLPDAYFGIGMVYYNLNSYDRAAQALARAAYLAPEVLEHVPDKLLLKIRQGISRLR